MNSVTNYLDGGVDVAMAEVHLGPGAEDAGGVVVGSERDLGGLRENQVGVFERLRLV